MISTNEDFDILLVNGNVADGSGSAPAPGDVGVRGGMIAECGDLRAASAKQRATSCDSCYYFPDKKSVVRRPGNGK